MVDYAEGSKGRKEYRTSVGGKIAGFIKSHEQEARETEKEIAHVRYELENAIDSFLKNPNDDIKIVIESKHAIFVKKTHQLKAVLQRLEKELVEKLKEFTEDIEKKKIKVISLEKWQAIKEEIEDFSNELYDVIYWEKKQERRMKHGKRPHRMVNLVFGTNTNQRQRMLRRSKRDRLHRTESESRSLKDLETQKDFFIKLWQANEKRQYEMKKKLKKVKKVNHKFGAALLKEENKESETTKKSLKFFRREVKNDLKKVAVTAAAISIMAGTTSCDPAKKIGVETKDKLRSTTEVARDMFKGEASNKNYINESRVGAWMEIDGEKYIVNFHHEGLEKNPMGVLILYDVSHKAVEAYVNPKVGDNQVDFYRIVGDEMYREENTDKHSKFYMSIRDNYQKITNDRSSKLVDIKKPFEIKKAKIKSSLKKTSENVVEAGKKVVENTSEFIQDQKVASKVRKEQRELEKELEKEGKANQTYIYYNNSGFQTEFQGQSVFVNYFNDDKDAYVVMYGDKKGKDLVEIFEFDGKLGHWVTRVHFKDKGDPVVYDGVPLNIKSELNFLVQKYISLTKSNPSELVTLKRAENAKEIRKLCRKSSKK